MIFGSSVLYEQVLFNGVKREALCFAICCMMAHLVKSIDIWFYNLILSGSPSSTYVSVEWKVDKKSTRFALLIITSYPVHHHQLMCQLNGKLTRKVEDLHF